MQRSNLFYIMGMRLELLEYKVDTNVIFFVFREYRTHQDVSLGGVVGDVRLVEGGNFAPDRSVLRRAYIETQLLGYKAREIRTKVFFHRPVLRRQSCTHK